MSTAPLAFLRPSISPEKPLHDLMETLSASLPEPHRLELTGQLPAGFYELCFETRDGSFDTDSVMMELTEWPSQRSITLGPWDFDHTDYKMMVPTYWVEQDGEIRGLAWTRVPSPDDLRRKRLRASCGLHVAQAGEVTLVLTVSEEDRDRLRWADLALLQLLEDEREMRPLPQPVNAWKLLMDNQDFERHAVPAPLQRELLDQLSQKLEQGKDDTYGYRTATAALVGRITGNQTWISEAIKRTMNLCERPHWGYHDIPWIMGWNSDRDAGIRMFETAAVLLWLDDELNDEQRQKIRDKLAYHADIAYRITLLQRDYWYFRTCEAHGQGLWFGLLAAAIALGPHNERAPEWLQWCYSNLIESITWLPEDGITLWYVFNIQWHILSVMIVEYLLDQPIPVELPFLRQFGERITRFTDSEEARGSLPPLLFFLASRFQDADMQADALAACKLGGRHGGERQPGAVDLFTLIACDPDLEPGTARRVSLSTRSRNGTVVCRNHKGQQSLEFNCGTPLSPRAHAVQNWINQCWHHAQHMGSIRWQVDGVQVLIGNLHSYRLNTGDANIISVNGAGSYTHGRWVGYDVPLRILPVIEEYATADGITRCRANQTPAYVPEAGVEHAERAWIFLHELDAMLLYDRIRTTEPADLVWHMHANRGRWQREGDIWRTTTDKRTVNVVLSHSMGDGTSAELTATPELPQWIPTYPFGLNKYKTADWQPELRPGKLDIPDFEDLRVSPPAGTRDWQLITLISSGTTLPDKLADKEAHLSLIRQHLQINLDS